MQNRVSQALRAPARGRAPPGRRHAEAVADPDHGRAPAVAGRHATTRCTCATTRRCKIKDELARLPGVGQAALFGSGDYAMRVWLDPDKVAARGLTAGDVVRAIREQNVQVSAGQLGAEPTPNGSDFLVSINAQGRLQTEEEFGDIVDQDRRRRRDRAPRRRRAARARRRRLHAALAARQQGRGRDRRSSRRPAPTRSSCPTRCAPRWPSSPTRFPEGMTYDVVYDPTVFVRDSIKAVVTTLFEAVLLVVLVVILFLQTWRASIIPLLAVPVSIVGTFAALLPARLLDQHADPVRAGARDRHRRRRRDRRGRERRAQHRGGQVAARGGAPGDARGLRARSSRSRWCCARCSCRWRS